MSEERSWPELQAAYARGELVDEPLLLMLLQPPQVDPDRQPRPPSPADRDAASPERRTEPGGDELADAQRGDAAVDAE